MEESNLNEEEKKETDTIAKNLNNNITEKKDLAFILDIPLELSVELGKSRMIINDLLKLGQGSIIELDKLAGEPLEIYINRKLIAKGEVVVVNEKFGIRLIDIITPLERVRRLSTKKTDF